jgi:hypothetical protein
MTPIPALVQEACGRVSAEAKARGDAYSEAVTARNAAGEAYSKANRVEDECRATWEKSRRPAMIADRLANGDCASNVNDSYAHCSKPAKSVCKECGGPFCAAHVKGGKHDCDEWRRIARDVLGIAEREEVA